MKKKFRSPDKAPFTYLVPSLTNISISILILLCMQIFMLFITKSFNSIIIIALSTIASVCAEFTNNRVRKIKTIFNMTAVIHGVMIGMFIPSNYPIIPIFFAVYISLFFSKYFFGLLSDSWINPVAFTVVILYLTGISFFPEVLISPSIIENGKPGIDLIQSGAIPVLNDDSSISFWLNTHIFSTFGIEIPAGYISLFWDSQSSIPAFRFNILVLLSSVFLFSFDMLNWVIPGVFLFVYGILVLLFSQTPFTGVVGQGDILFAFLTSGTLFTAFFLLDFYGTAPGSFFGKIIYAFIAGVIAFFICGCGTSSIGCMFTILLVNIISPFIQYFEEKIYSLLMEKRLRKNNYA
ncbi:MAG: RnfABCDGE type electron transport complex subunit D [Treponemataceae bacterium]